MVTTSSTHPDASCVSLPDQTNRQLSTPGLPLTIIRTVPSLTFTLITFLGPPDSGSIFDFLFSDSDGVMTPGRGRH